MKITQGAIVWATVNDPQGHNPNKRPFIVVEAVSAEEIYAVAISSAEAIFKEGLLESCVELPFHPQGNVCTGLKRRSAAVCNWVAILKTAEVQLTTKRCPAQQLQEIIDKIAGS